MTERRKRNKCICAYKTNKERELPNICLSLLHAPEKFRT